jgi:hypothetical protein
MKGDETRKNKTQGQSKKDKRETGLKKAKTSKPKGAETT